MVLYVEALNEIENFENNFKFSAILDFQSFIILKKQEMELDSDDDVSSLVQNKTSKTLKTQQVINVYSNYGELLNNVHQELAVNKINFTEEEKEALVDLFFEYEGYYSTKNSSNLIFSGFVKDKKKVAKILYSLIVCLFLFMCISIYLGLYNFFINKTLVVNIFLQINK